MVLTPQGSALWLNWYMRAQVCGSFYILGPSSVVLLSPQDSALWWYWQLSTQHCSWGPSSVAVKKAMSERAKLRCWQRWRRTKRRGSRNFPTPASFSSRHRCPHRNFAKLFLHCGIPISVIWALWWYVWYSNLGTSFVVVFTSWGPALWWYWHSGPNSVVVKYS